MESVEIVESIIQPKDAPDVGGEREGETVMGNHWIKYVGSLTPQGKEDFYLQSLQT